MGARGAPGAGLKATFDGDMRVVVEGRRPRLPKRLAFSLTPLLLLLVAAELVLRATGAASRCPSDDLFFVWVCDPILYFRPNPDLVVNGQRQGHDLEAETLYSRLRAEGIVMTGSKVTRSGRGSSG